MVKLGLLIAGLLVTGAATLAEGLLGADLTPGPVAMLATAIAAVVVWRTRKPLVGLIVAAWLALGPFAMPWSLDNLSQPEHTGIFTFTVVQLAANAVALIIGISAQAERKRRTATPHPDEITRDAEPPVQPSKTTGRTLTHGPRPE